MGIGGNADATNNLISLFADHSKALVFDNIYGISTKHIGNDYLG